MSKRICILNGSPRLTGNTKELIHSFTRGAESVGHEVICFDLQTMNIHGCLGCCKGGLVSHLNWKNMGIVYAGGNMEIGDILKQPYQLESAEQLGKSI